MSGSGADDPSLAQRRRGRRERTPPDRQQAWDYLLNVLSRQSYTVAELRTKLARRKASETLIEELLSRLVELRLVDDKTYAEQYVASRQESRGRLALGAELRRKGVAEEIVDARLGSLGDEQQLAAAIGMLRKNAWRYRPAAASDGRDPTIQAGGHVEEDGYAATVRLRQAEAKAKSFLARRGFTPDVVAAAVDRVGWFAS